MRRLRIWLAVVILLAASGYVNIVLSHGKDVPLRRPLADFPLRIDDWRGRGHWLSKKVLDILRVDDYMMRLYVDERGRKIWLYAGYFESQREGQLVHSPKHCLPGSGWRPISSKRILIDIPGLDVSPVEATMMVTQRRDEKELVIYWYQVGGDYVAGEYAQKLRLVWNAIRYNRTDGALIRFNGPIINGDVDDTYAVMEGFIRKVVPMMRGYLPV